MADTVLPQTSSAFDAPSTSVAAVTLSDGRGAVLTREALGRDVEKASAVIGMQKLGNPLSLMLGLFAQVGTIGGAPVVYEDLLDLPWADTIAIMGLMGADPEKK
jgi:hypothetical protein